MSEMEPLSPEDPGFNSWAKKELARLREAVALQRQMEELEETRAAVRFARGQIKRFPYHGLTAAQRSILKEQAGYRCEVCARLEDPADLTTKLCVDHNHRNGMIRGVICTACNTALGCVRDDPAILQSLVIYLGGYE